MNSSTQCSAEMEAAREWFKNYWRPTHMAALDKLQDGPSGRIEPINADDCPDVPEMMEVIAEVRRLAREGYEEACEQYGQEWWDEHVERFERYPLVYGLYRAGEEDVQCAVAGPAGAAADVVPEPETSRKHPRGADEVESESKRADLGADLSRFKSLDVFSAWAKDNVTSSSGMTVEAKLAWVLDYNSRVCSPEFSNEQIFAKAVKDGDLHFLQTLFNDMRLKHVVQIVKHLRRDPTHYVCEHLAIDYEKLTVSQCKLTIIAYLKENPFRLHATLNFLSEL